MSQDLTAEDKHRLLDLHAQHELAHDWDAVLNDTMNDDPFYLYYPLGLRISGGDAVQEHWKRVMSQPCMNVELLMSSKEERWFRGDSLVQRIQWPVTGSDGVTRDTTLFAIYDFDHGARKIQSETAFVDDILIAGLADVFTDESFLSLPGVSRLGERTQALG